MTRNKCFPQNPSADWVLDDVTALWFAFRYGDAFVEKLQSLESPFRR